MKQIEIEQLANEHKIIRFLDKDGLMKTLGIQNQHKIPRQITDLNPTFMLKSLKQYQMLEDQRGDQYENSILTSHTVTGTPILESNLDPVLVSCWSQYQYSDLDNPTTWLAFPENAIAAIESTVEDIKNVIDWMAPIPKESAVEHEENCGSLRAALSYHGKVIYYSQNDVIYNYHIGPKQCFFKRREPYSNEREYRFMIRCNIHPQFSPEIFCVRLKSTNYIKRIYLKDGGLKEELRGLTPYYSDRIF